MKTLTQFINEASVLDPTQDKVESAANRIADITSFPKKSNCYKDEDGYWTYTWVLSPDGLKEYLQDESVYKKVKVAKTVKMTPNAIQMCFWKNKGTIFGDVLGEIRFIGEDGRYEFCFVGGGYNGVSWDTKTFKQRAYDFFCQIRDDKDTFQKWAKLRVGKRTYLSYEKEISKIFN
jgi:hypothetical protein